MQYTKGVCLKPIYAVPVLVAANHPWRRYGRHLNGQPIQEAVPDGAD
jgi:hypothetical protein